MSAPRQRLLHELLRPFGIRRSQRRYILLAIEMIPQAMGLVWRGDAPSGGDP